MKTKNVLFLILFTITTYALNAQIIYTDITDGVPEMIDFNQDGTAEFTIDTYGTNFPGDYISYYDTEIQANNNIHALGTDDYGWDTPNFVNAGFSINSSCNWIGYGDCSIDSWGDGNSSLLTNQDIYLAVKFSLSGSDLFYGWIRVYYDGTNIIYKDYAYNSTANTAINAGDMGSDILVTNISVSTNGGITEINTMNGTLQMYANVSPADATDASITWSVTNGTGSASISQTGLLQAQTDGTVTVVATANDESNISGSLEISISNQTPNLISEIIVTSENGNTEINELAGTLQMIATVSPADATDASVTWSVTNGTGRASISQTGLLQAMMDGTVTVYATANDGSNVNGSLEITINTQASNISLNNISNIQIYPNPTQDILNINNISNGDISIFSVDGKLVYQNSINNTNTSIDISSFKNGIYYIVISSETIKFNTTIMKQ